MNILLLAAGFPSQYRVLRCSAASGAKVFLLAENGARGLRRSRYCRRYIPSTSELSVENSSKVAEQVNACVDQFAIDCVVAGDAKTTRVLTHIRQEIQTQVFPMPSLAVFDTLNDKARFADVCEELGVPYPATQVAVSKSDLRERYARGEIRIPSIMKPLDMYGSLGVLKLASAGCADLIADVDYEPILIQDFVEGKDISIAMYCQNGNVLAEVTYFLEDGVFHFIRNEIFSEDARKIVSHVAYDGVIGFDARLSAHARDVAFLECNPRFWYNMDIALVAGINFVKLGLDRAQSRKQEGWEALVNLPPQTSFASVPTRTALLGNIYRPWTLTTYDKRMLRYVLADIPLSVPKLQGRPRIRSRCVPAR